MSDAWIGAYGVLWVAVLLLGFVTLGMARTIRLSQPMTGGEIGEPFSDGLADGEAVPSFAGRTTSGQTLASDDLLGRQWAILFLSQSCEPCQSLAAELRRGDWTEIGSDVVVVVKNSDGEDPFDIGVRSSVIAERGNEVARLFRTAVTPRAFLIGGDGRVLASGFPNTLQQLRDLAVHAGHSAARPELAHVGSATT